MFQTLGIKPIFFFILLILLFASCKNELPVEVSEAYAELPKKVDFNFHIRPILSDRCFKCHGPDEKARKAEDYAVAA